MPDLVAVGPGSELVARPDAQERDLWARTPFYPGPGLIAYGLGAIAIVTAGGPSSVNVDTSPSAIVWAPAAPALLVEASSSPSAIAWQSVTAQPLVTVGTSPSAIAWVAVTAVPHTDASTTVDTTPPVITWSTVDVATWRRRWRPVMDYSVTFSAHYSRIFEPIGAGYVVARNSTNWFVVATAAHLAAGAVPVAVALTSGDQKTPIQMQSSGELDATLVEMTPGVEAFARIGSTGRIERVTSPSAADYIIGKVDTNGNVQVAFAASFPRSASAAPTTGTWARGNVVYNSAPSAAGYVGWVCTASGTPGTWKGFGAIEP